MSFSSLTDQQPPLRFLGAQVVEEGQTSVHGAKEEKHGNKGIDWYLS